MKKVIGLVVLALLGAGTVFGGMISEDPGELTVSGQYWFPGAGDYDLFKRGYGATVSYREWFSFPWGVGVNLGLAQWQVDSGSNALKYKELSDYDGDALLIPLGASLYFNVIDWDNWNLILNTGLQYVFVDSNVSVYNAEETVKARQDVDIGNVLLWDIGAEYDYMITENLFMVGGVGYQIDIIDGDTEYNNRSARVASLEGMYLQLGCKMLF